MRAALDKCVTGMCTEKPVAIDKSTATGKTEQRKTEQRKTEERKTQNKETGRTTLKSHEDGIVVPRISVTIGIGGSPDRHHRRENHHRSGGDSGGRSDGGFGIGGSPAGGIGFGR